jgi:hypothetical protein
LDTRCLLCARSFSSTQLFSGIENACTYLFVRYARVCPVDYWCVCVVGGCGAGHDHFDDVVTSRGKCARWKRSFASKRVMMRGTSAGEEEEKEWQTASGGRWAEATAVFLSQCIQPIQSQCPLDIFSLYASHVWVMTLTSVTFLHS